VGADERRGPLSNLEPKPVAAEQELWEWLDAAADEMLASVSAKEHVAAPHPLRAFEPSPTPVSRR